MSAAHIQPLPQRPVLADGVRRTKIDRLTVVTSPTGDRHLQLDEDGERAVAALNGSATVEELSERFGPELRELVEELYLAGFLVGSPPRSDRRVVLTSQGVEFAGAHRWVDLVYPLARPLFSRVGAVILAGSAALGLVLVLTGALPAPLAHTRPVASTVLAILLLDLVLVVAHESAHALVLRHHGERIGRVGVGPYWGGLSFYVDATAALHLPRRARILQAAAGLISDAALVGVLAVVAVLVAPHPAGAVLAQAAVMVMLGVLLNATPLLQLDGYWMLSDALDSPDLHQRARSALRAYLQGERSTGTAALALYAVLGVLLGLALLASALFLWLAVFWPLLTALWSQGLLSRFLAVLLALPVFAPLAVDLTSNLVRATSSLLRHR